MLERAEKSHKSAARLPEKKYAERPGGLENTSMKANKRRNRSSGNNRTFCWKADAHLQEMRRIWVTKSLA